MLIFFREPSSISGILKTVYLVRKHLIFDPFQRISFAQFLEGQRLRQTCKILLEESSALGFPNIRSAVANVLVLKPSFAEIVKVTHADPCRCLDIELKDKCPRNARDSKSPDGPTIPTCAARVKTIPQAKNEIQGIVQTVPQEKSMAPGSMRADQTLNGVGTSEEIPESDADTNKPSNSSGDSEELVTGVH